MLFLMAFCGRRNMYFSIYIDGDDFYDIPLLCKHTAILTFYKTVPISFV